LLFYSVEQEVKRTNPSISQFVQTVLKTQLSPKKGRVAQFSHFDEPPIITTYARKNSNHLRPVLNRFYAPLRKYHRSNIWVGQNNPTDRPFLMHRQGISGTHFHVACYYYAESYEPIF